MPFMCAAVDEVVGFVTRDFAPKDNVGWLLLAAVVVLEREIGVAAAWGPRRREGGMIAMVVPGRSRDDYSIMEGVGLETGTAEWWIRDVMQES